MRKPSTVQILTQKGQRLSSLFNTSALHYAHTSYIRNIVIGESRGVVVIFFYRNASLPDDRSRSDQRRSQEFDRHTLGMVDRGAWTKARRRRKLFLPSTLLYVTFWVTYSGLSEKDITPWLASLCSSSSSSALRPVLTKRRNRTVMFRRVFQCEHGWDVTRLVFTSRQLVHTKKRDGIVSKWMELILKCSEPDDWMKNWPNLRYVSCLESQTRSHQNTVRRLLVTERNETVLLRRVAWCEQSTTRRNWIFLICGVFWCEQVCDTTQHWNRTVLFRFVASQRALKCEIKSGVMVIMK